MKTLKELLEYGRRSLREHKIENADGDAWYLLEFVCEIDKSYYFIHCDDIIEEIKIVQYQELMQKRCSHVPLQQLTGSAWFMGFEFYVNSSVLIPRQDTETLVETALMRLKKEAQVLDVCTGSGCIILSLAKMGDAITTTGCDISGEALCVARKNARSLSCDTTFVQSDLFDVIEGQYDMIVSNPPYIRSDVIPTLMEEVRDFEPHLALDGKEDGLYFYRKIISEAADYLKDDGWLGFEIGHDQGEAVSGMLKEQNWREVEVIQDLAGLDRVVWAKRP